MMTFQKQSRKSKAYKVICVFVMAAFVMTSVVPPQASYAQLIPQVGQAVLGLPIPGTMVGLTPAHAPAIIKGITVDPANPLNFKFLVDTGHENLKGEELRAESEKLIKYFMAALTVPEEEMWVNLSPYEKDRMIPESFGVTEMGRDLLAQDYMLKQLSASLVYPEDELGQKFWKRVQAQVYEKYGSVDVPMNTFNKIWIVPEKAVVFEHEGTAFVVESHLKVMMEEDYLALRENAKQEAGGSGEENNLGTHRDTTETSAVTSQIIKEIVVPEIEKEVNEGATFAQLRKIYSSMILATWYKLNLKESLLGQVYVDKNKTLGIEVEDKAAKEKIYQQYLEAFKKGVYDYIKEEYDPASHDIIPRKYFSGGTVFAPLPGIVREGMITPEFFMMLPLSSPDRAMVVNGLAPVSRTGYITVDAAMLEIPNAASLPKHEEAVDAAMAAKALEQTSDSAMIQNLDELNAYLRTLEATRDDGKKYPEGLTNDDFHRFVLSRLRDGDGRVIGALFSTIKEAFAYDPSVETSKNPTLLFKYMISNPGVIDAFSTIIKNNLDDTEDIKGGIQEWAKIISYLYDLNVAMDLQRFRKGIKVDSIIEKYPGQVFDIFVNLRDLELIIGQNENLQKFLTVKEMNMIIAAQANGSEITTVLQFMNVQHRLGKLTAENYKKNLRGMILGSLRDKAQLSDEAMASKADQAMGEDVISKKEAQRLVSEFMPYYLRKGQGVSFNQGDLAGDLIRIKFWIDQDVQDARQVYVHALGNIFGSNRDPLQGSRGWRLEGETSDGSYSLEELQRDTAAENMISNNSVFLRVVNAALNEAQRQHKNIVELFIDDQEAKSFDITGEVDTGVMAAAFIAALVKRDLHKTGRYYFYSSNGAVYIVPAGDENEIDGGMLADGFQKSNMTRKQLDQMIFDFLRNIPENRDHLASDVLSLNPYVQTYANMLLDIQHVIPRLAMSIRPDPKRMEEGQEQLSIAQLAEIIKSLLRIRTSINPLLISIRDEMGIEAFEEYFAGEIKRNAKYYKSFTIIRRNLSALIVQLSNEIGITTPTIETAKEYLTQAITIHTVGDPELGISFQNNEVIIMDGADHEIIRTKIGSTPSELFRNVRRALIDMSRNNNFGMQKKPQELSLFKTVSEQIIKMSILSDAAQLAASRDAAMIQVIWDYLGEIDSEKKLRYGLRYELKGEKDGTKTYQELAEFLGINQGLYERSFVNKIRGYYSKRKDMSLALSKNEYSKLNDIYIELLVLGWLQKTGALKVELNKYFLISVIQRDFTRREESIDTTVNAASDLKAFGTMGKNPAGITMGNVIPEIYHLGLTESLASLLQREESLSRVLATQIAQFASKIERTDSDNDRRSLLQVIFKGNKNWRGKYRQMARLLKIDKQLYAPEFLNTIRDYYGKNIKTLNQVYVELLVFGLAVKRGDFKPAWDLNDLNRIILRDSLRQAKNVKTTAIAPEDLRAFTEFGKNPGRTKAGSLINRLGRTSVKRSLQSVIDSMKAFSPSPTKDKAMTVQEQVERFLGGLELEVQKGEYDYLQRHIRFSIREETKVSGRDTITGDLVFSMDIPWELQTDPKTTLESVVELFITTFLKKATQYSIEDETIKALKRRAREYPRILESINRAESNFMLPLLSINIADLAQLIEPEKGIAAIEAMESSVNSHDKFYFDSADGQERGVHGVVLWSDRIVTSEQASFKKETLLIATAIMKGLYFKAPQGENWITFAYDGSRSYPNRFGIGFNAKLGEPKDDDFQLLALNVSTQLNAMKNMFKSKSLLKNVKPDGAMLTATQLRDTLRQMSNVIQQEMAIRGEKDKPLIGWAQEQPQNSPPYRYQDALRNAGGEISFFMNKVFNQKGLLFGDVSATEVTDEQWDKIIKFARTYSDLQEIAKLAEIGAFGFKEAGAFTTLLGKLKNARTPDENDLVDQATLAKQPGQPLGGIDLNPALLNLQIKRDGNGIPLPLNLQPIGDMKIEGFIPMIINITPAANVPMLLGIADQVPAEPVDTAGETGKDDLAFFIEKKQPWSRLEENLSV